MLRLLSGLAICLALVAPASAEDLTFDRLKLTLPDGWTVKTAGEIRRLLPGGALAGKGEALAIPSFKHEGKGLEALAAVVLVRVEKGRTGQAGSKPKTSKTSAGLSVGFCGRRTVDARGKLRFANAYVFDVGGGYAQAIYVGAHDIESFKQINAALNPCIDKATAVTPSAAPEPKATGPASTFDLLTFPLPTGWKQRRVEEAGKPYWELIPPGGEDARVFVYPSADRKGLELAVVARRLLDLGDKQREVTERGAAKTYRTPNGLTVVVRSQASKRPGGITRLAMVYVFQVGGGYQAVYLVATPARFPSVRQALDSALRAARTSGGSAPPVAAPPKVGSPGGSRFAEQGVLGTTSTATVPQSAKLSPVPHKVAWFRNRPLSPQNADVVYGTNKAGDVFWVLADKAARRHKVWESQVQVWLGRGPRLTPSPVTLPAIHKLLTAKLGRGPKYGWEPYRFQQLEIDQSGNVYALIKLTFSDFPVVVHYRWDTKALEVVASPHYLGKLCREAKLDSFVNARWAFHTDPQGGSGWLLLHDRFGKRIVIRHLRRAKTGAWSAVTVSPRYRDAAKYGTPGSAALRMGAPDGRGGWVFYSGMVLWRLLPTGQSWPLAVFRFGSESVWIPRPAVLANGDVWFAINRRYGHNSSTDALGRTHVFGLVGDRSRWIRVRLDGKGGVKLGEIDGKVLLTSLQAAGAKLGGGSLVKTLQPLPDPKTGGILAYDTAQELFYVIQPTD